MMGRGAGLAFCLGVSLLAGGCGEPDARSFQAENAIFESIYLDRAELGANRDAPENRAAVGSGLSAICRGDVSGARRLIREGGIGPQIYQLVLIAAKAARDRCDYSNWHDRQALLGERFKQLVGSGDASAVLLAAMMDRSLAEADRLQVVKALSDKRYGHAEAIYAGTLISGETAAADFQKAIELLEDAAKQGAAPAQLLLARMYEEGRGTPRDLGKACKYLRDAASNGVEAARNRFDKLRDGEACR